MYVLNTCNSHDLAIKIPVGWTLTLLAVKRNEIGFAFARKKEIYRYEWNLPQIFLAISVNTFLSIVSTLHRTPK